ncbi:hypothetical protein [Citrobacter amalonaticus]|uniref:hypothetical protein n=1 Tax=Citrobacter amalonaticus TaxID=35703 RepID=UPI00300CDDE3
MYTRTLNPLIRAIGRALTHLTDYPQHECGPDSIAVTLAENNIFAVAMTIADERACNDALIAYVFGDQMPLTPVVLNGLLYIPGIFPEILFEPRYGQLICTRASVDELIRSQARIEKDVSSAAELRDTCNQLEAFFRLPSEFRRPTRIHRWKNDSGQPCAGKPRPITGCVVDEKRHSLILNAKGLRAHMRHIHHTVERLLGGNTTQSAFSPQETEPDSGTVLCELLSDATEGRLAAPVAAVPYQSPDPLNFFTHDTGLQETPSRLLSFILYYCVIRPSQPGIFYLDNGPVLSYHSQSFVSGKWPCHTISLLHCRGPPDLIIIYPELRPGQLFPLLFRCIQAGR